MSIAARASMALQQGRPRAGLALLGLAAASVLTLLVEGSFSTGVPIDPPFRHFDKLLHAGAHFWVCSLLVWGLALLRRWRAGAALIALATDTAAGIAVELAQKWLGAAHGRQFNYWDVAANVLGASAAAAAFLVVASSLHRTYTMAEMPRP